VAETQDQAVPPEEPRRRLPRWVAIAVAAAIVALAVLGVAALLADDESPEEEWEACAERIDPPAARSDRLEEFAEAEDEDAARDRLAEEIRAVERRIVAECGERP
jgi:type VI protein secretion system component VasF